jgi:hypothetical protein
MLIKQKALGITAKGFLFKKVKLPHFLVGR